MNVGIYDLNESSELNYKMRLEIYKQVGFTSVGVYLDDRYMSNDEKYVDIIKYAKNIGLRVNQIHLDYKISNEICNDNSDEYFEYVEKKLQECVELQIPYIVLHASKGEDAPSISDLGIKKLAKLLSKYTRVTLCFENVRNNKNLIKILDANIHNVGMCYDLGHAYCYDDVEKLFEDYKDKIICTHLHNNYKKDTHNTLFDGEINCRKIIGRLNQLHGVDNCLEVFPPRGVILDEIAFKNFVEKVYAEYVDCLGIKK